MSLGELVIGLQANTAQFQSDLGKAVKTIENFAIKTGDVSRGVDKAFKDLTRSGKNTSEELQRSFNALNIKSDFTMTVQKEALVKAKDFFLRQFQMIGEAAHTSAKDVKRAFDALNLAEAQLDAQVLKNEFAALGIKSSAEIEAMKIKVTNSFEEIRRSGLATTADIVRAHEAMNVEVTRLNGLLVTQEERGNAEKLRSEKEMLEEAYRLNEKFTRQKQQLLKQQQADFAKFKASEQASYAAYGMSTPDAAARLVGQLQAGSQFSKQLQSQMEEVAGSTNKAAEKMNLFGLASIGTILKVQILFSAVNTLMSAIGRAPSVAIAAIEDYNASIIKNAAMITSIQTGVKDIGKAYQDNFKYATAVQNVLIKMDAETAASAKQLQLMNDQFVLQGVLIDTNNKKQIDGFKNIANALSAITGGDPNKDMQFSQEVRALLNGEEKAGNRLLQIMKSLDPEIQNHLKEWKRIGEETGNYGYMLEQIGPLLKGFAAAQGDINNLWETVKSTMATIRDEVLRGGLAQGFAKIVERMKELSKYAQENKEKIQAFLKKAFDDASSLAKVFFDIGGAIVKIGEPLVWSVITAGLFSAVGAARTFATEMTIATGGVNLLVAALGSLALYSGKKYYDNKALDERVNNIRNKTFDNGASGNSFNRDQLLAVLANNPLASDDDIVEWKRRNAIGGGSNFFVNQNAINFLKNNKDNVPYPKGISTNTKDDEAIKKAEEYLKVMKQLEKERFALALKENPYLDETSKRLEENAKKYSDLIELYPDHRKELLATEKLDADLIKQMSTTNALFDHRKTVESEAEAAGLAFGFDSAMNKGQELGYKPKPNVYTLTGPGYTGFEQQTINTFKEDELRLKEQLLSIDYESELGKISELEMLKQKQNVLNDLYELQSANGDKEQMQTLKSIQKNQVLIDQYSALGGMKQFFAQLDSQIENTGAQIKSVMDNAFSSATDAIMNFVETGKFAFADLTKAILKDIAKIQIQKALAGIANGIFAGMTTSTPQATSTWNGVSAGNVGAPAWQGPSFDVGTDYVPKDMLAMVHKGEKITPAAYNRNSDVSDMKIEIINQSGQAVKGRDGGSKFDGKSFVKTIILEAMDTDWSFRNAVRG